MNEHYYSFDWKDGKFHISLNGVVPHKNRFIGFNNGIFQIDNIESVAKEIINRKNNLYNIYQSNVSEMAKIMAELLA